MSTCSPLSKILTQSLITLSHNIWTYHMFQQLYIRDTGDNYKQELHVLFLKGKQMFARSHSLGISPVSRDCWKCANTRPCSFVSSSGLNKQELHVLFLKGKQMFARSHSLGISPVSRDCWKCANTRPCSFVSSSGLKAFEGFKPFK